MVATPTIGRVIAAALEAEEVAKHERARAMDAIIDLLFERAHLRALLREAEPYLQVAAARSDALADRAMMPKVLAAEIREALDV